MNKLSYISLFSSAGIGCYGFKLEGFECIATSELIEKRLAIQRYNNKCLKNDGYIFGDITDNDTKNKIFSTIESWNNQTKNAGIDVVIATPPCQGMSVANHKKSKNEIIRNSLVIEAINLIQKINPRFFILENVPAFMKTLCCENDSPKTISETIFSKLSKQYEYIDDIINFKTYGANSSRNRALVIGVRKDMLDDISPIELFPDYSEEKTLFDVIGNLPELKQFGEISDTDIYHSFREYKLHMREWVMGLGEGQSAFENTDITKIPHQIKNGTRVIHASKNGDKYKRQTWNKTAPCVHTRNDILSSQNTIHPRDDRVFSIRELMYMMNIPDSFQWSDKPISALNELPIPEKKIFLKENELNIRQCIGEAVPTIILQQIARKIKEHLSREHKTDLQLKKIINDQALYETTNLIKFIKKCKDELGTHSIARLIELSNNLRLDNAAYYTDKILLTEIYKILPEFDKQDLRILEPSVGAGGFIPLIIKKYSDVSSIIIDVCDIDSNILEILKIILPKAINIKINFICADFLTHDFPYQYDLIIGNPPFIKLKSNDKKLLNYRTLVGNKTSTNLSALFLEKSCQLSNQVIMVMPKFFLNTSDFLETRNKISYYCISDIVDFGEKGFKGVLIETICVKLNTKLKPKITKVISLPQASLHNQNQSYILDSKLPYWIIYRNGFFDSVYNNMKFNIFSSFRDRQVTNKSLKPMGDIWVIKSRNISKDGKKITKIQDYDSYINMDSLLNLKIRDYLNRDDVFLTPNMTYYPRVIKKPTNTIVNGSVAILSLTEGNDVTQDDLDYYASDEFREFYSIARNRATRSLNIDKNATYFFGIRK